MQDSRLKSLIERKTRGGGGNLKIELADTRKSWWVGSQQKARRKQPGATNFTLNGCEKRFHLGVHEN